MKDYRLPSSTGTFTNILGETENCLTLGNFIVFEGEEVKLSNEIIGELYECAGVEYPDNVINAVECVSFAHIEGTIWGFTMFLQKQKSIVGKADFCVTREKYLQEQKEHQAWLDAIERRKDEEEINYQRSTIV